ncbi:hypothetical protein Hanom_Chr05g00396101 [Helianthus anomalus]
MWVLLLEEFPSTFKDNAIEHMKEHSRANNLAYSFLKGALSLVKDKMEFNSKEREKIFACK